MKESTDRQLNDIRKTMYGQNKTFNKGIKTIKKKPSTNPGDEEYNNSTEAFNRELNSSLDHAEEILS